MLAASITCEKTIKGKQINGYVQQITPYPKFSMINFTEEQLNCVKLLPYEDRVLHIDATGGLVSIKKCHTKDNYNDYNRILHYFCLLKNRQKKGGVIISELVSSAHDVFQISEFFLKTKFNFERLNGPNSFNFRLIVIDFASALIHSVLLVFNRQSVLEYANIVYKLAKEEVTYNETDGQIFRFIKIAKESEKIYMLLFQLTTEFKNISQNPTQL